MTTTTKDDSPTDIDPIKCSFCESEYTKDTDVYTASNAVICVKCVDICYSSKEEKEEKAVEDTLKVIQGELDGHTPKTIFSDLNEVIVGQSEAKRILSVALYNHYKRVLNKGEKLMVKSNVLMIGPTGVGKTLICESLAKISKTPFVHHDASSITSTGFHGGDVSDMIAALYRESDNDPLLCEYGIIYLDEVDKLVRQINRSHNSFGGDVQGELLKVIEGSDIYISTTPDKFNSPQIKINTKNILFILGGSFPQLESIITSRTKSKTSIGITADIQHNKINYKDTINNMQLDDLMTFGFQAELLGRLPVVVNLNKIDVNDMYRILTEPKDSIIVQYQNLFNADGIDLRFNDNAIKSIADKAMKFNVGARSLRSILEAILLPLMFESPSNNKIRKVTITKKMVEGVSPPNTKNFTT